MRSIIIPPVIKKWLVPAIGLFWLIWLGTVSYWLLLVDPKIEDDVQRVLNTLPPGQVQGEVTARVVSLTGWVNPQQRNIILTQLRSHENIRSVDEQWQIKPLVSEYINVQRNAEGWLVSGIVQNSKKKLHVKNWLRDIANSNLNDTALIINEDAGVTVDVSVLTTATPALKELSWLGVAIANGRVHVSGLLPEMARANYDHWISELEASLSSAQGKIINNYRFSHGIGMDNGEQWINYTAQSELQTSAPQPESVSELAPASEPELILESEQTQVLQKASTTASAETIDVEAKESQGVIEQSQDASENADPATVATSLADIKLTEQLPDIHVQADAVVGLDDQQQTGGAALNNNTSASASVNILDQCQRQFDDILASQRIAFSQGSSVIPSTQANQRLLESLIRVLDNCPSMAVEIAGFTDSLGSESSNQRLSEARAQVVEAVFVAAGLDAQRFTVKGYGEKFPKYDNNTRDGRRLNRRIEMRVIR